MVQRTEVVLRVNAATSDAASQTDLMEQTAEQNIVKQEEPLLPEPRKKLPEEIECEELSRDLASQLSPNDKLVPILGNHYFQRILYFRSYPYESYGNFIRFIYGGP